MQVQLTAAHWIYLAGIVVILITMAMRKNIVVPAVAATMLTAWAFSGSIITGLSSIFNASLVAAQELFNIFLIIALETPLLLWSSFGPTLQHSVKIRLYDVPRIDPALPRGTHHG